MGGRIYRGRSQQESTESRLQRLERLTESFLQSTEAFSGANALLSKLGNQTDVMPNLFFIPPRPQGSDWIDFAETVNQDDSLWGISLCPEVNAVLNSDNFRFFCADELPKDESLEFFFITAVSKLRSTWLKQTLDLKESRNIALRHRLEQAETQLSQIRNRLQISEADYERLRHRDPITGLSNRAALLFRLSKELENAKLGQQVTFSLVLINLKRFKVVNGSLGNLKGDAVLTEIGKSLRRTVRQEDMVARLGNDEFAVLSAGLSETKAKRLATRLLEESRLNLSIDGKKVPVAASFGAVLADSRYSRPDEILRDAYVALNRGRSINDGSLVFFDRSCHLEDTICLELEADILRGLDKGEFQLVYQPVINVANSTISGFEGLIRWNHPKFGSVSPGLFIPVAEVSGLILPLGQWLLARGLRDFIHLRRQSGDENLFLSLNVSRHELLRPDYPMKVSALLDRYGIDAKNIRLEVTETACIASGAQILHNLRQLRKLGCGIFLDDFGVGQSSLGELYRMPLDGLKVDRAFIVAAKEPRGLALLKSIAEMGHALGLVLIAEGIENAQQLRNIALAQCELAQGFYWGKGVYLEEALQLFESFQLGLSAQEAG